MKIITDYYNQIPEKTGEQALKGFLVGFGVTIINAAFNSSSIDSFTRNLLPSVKVGAFWATATILHGVIAPLFKRLFNTPDKYTEALRGGLALTGTVFLARAFNYSNIAALRGYLILYTVNVFVHNYACPTTRTSVIAPAL